MARSLQVLALMVALVISGSFLPAGARMLNEDSKLANSQQKFKHGLPSFALPPKPHHPKPTLPTLPSLPSCSPPPASPVSDSVPAVAPPAPVYSPPPPYTAPPAGGY